MKKALHFILFLSCIGSMTAQTPSNFWTPQAVGLLPKNHDILAISVVNKDVVWAVADSVFQGTVPTNHLIKVLKTTNGGTTWQLYKAMEVLGRISFDIQAIDSSVAWITAQSLNNGFARELFKTTNGGTTWVSKFVGTEAGVWLRFFDAQNAIIWNRTAIARSQDGGNTWTQSSISGFGASEYTIFISGTNACTVIGDTIWGGTSQSRVVRSTDKGQTWQFQNLQSIANFGTSVNILSLAFKDARNGIALGWNQNTYITYLARTTDGGATWSAMPTYPHTYGANVEYIKGTQGSFILTDYDGLTTYTTNFGQSWRLIDSLQSNALRFLDTKTGWVGNTGGSIRLTSANEPAMYKWNGGNILSSIKAFEPTEFSLNISPNPTSRYLTVSYSADFKPTELTLYDLAGKAVFQKKDPSVFSQVIDLEGLANGIYLLQLKNTEGVVAAQKVVVER